MIAPADVLAWRKEKRGELIERRQGVAPDERRRTTDFVNASLEQLFAPTPASVVAFCWPYKGEIDVRFAIRTLRERGVVAALPSVRAKASPLEFRAWAPGVPMSAGALGIPVPQNTDVVVPAVALVPLVGFDAEGYRLGYGGGYFDRTLAALPVKPITAGIGFELARLSTIHPQPHDIPMDLIVTEAGLHVVENGPLEQVDIERAAAVVKRLAAARGIW